MGTLPNTLTQTSKGYDQLRRKFFNERIPDIHPTEIKIGVRSGGHLFFCNALLGGGLLIDTRNLNREITYDAATKVASVSPGHKVEDVTNYLNARGRFFPAGHSRSVAVGGFLLAGGQGCFLRGWGYTAPSWITQLEVVTSEGETAAPGSGQGYFGVVTKIWVKTIPARRLFDTTIIVDSTDIFKPLLKWVFKTSKKVPKYGVDLFYCTFYADKDDPNGGHESAAKRVFFAINETIFADSFDEAKVLASPWDVFPDEFKKHIVTTVPLASDDKVINAITPALYDLPSRLSSGTLCPMDYYPDEEDQALSLPQKTYVSTMCCWKDPKQDAAMDKWLLDAYTKADEVSCGVYMADFNVMTDSALKKWLQIRGKWDPSETFIGHRGFSSVLDDKSGVSTKL
ncbi:uncharacterized protein NECHADRAFT_89277 [Fusarium vanettenii 77-13-4]|uniref:FAD-binding PCMH-type domain-containing protein n=1 Tax=Fusarium vanettenii (strain ATCC MYA-4622 / CBS 123669 / FGSC 9596 / NRRL 45880 / 77-13-4) TaxID=660122 RepID=C7ZQQ4_FUSV7|nr:uncharacterized protein NECHADRAFT_89277 [Fusarium vanettenii 77-13-4]EEU33648.1 hypothetical protein NECHADRAFT_89277 [Fusarium vanettenii 77-13-4]